MTQRGPGFPRPATLLAATCLVAASMAHPAAAAGPGRADIHATGDGLARLFADKANEALSAASDRGSQEGYRQAWLYTLTALRQGGGSVDRLPRSLERLRSPEVSLQAFRETWRSPVALAPVRNLAFSPDGKRLASASDDGAVRLWDVASGEEAARLQGHTARVWSVAFSPDGRLLATASEDLDIRLWDVVSGLEMARLLGHEAVVQTVAFSPDGSHLASGSDDHSIRLWDVASHCEIAHLRGFAARVWSVAFSPDGTHLAAGASDAEVRLVDVASSDVVLHLKGHTDRAGAVAFSPDGRLLASGSKDGTVRLWDTASGRETARFEAHARVWSVAYGPDGRRLAAGLEDHSIRLRDVASGREIAHLQGHTGRVWSVAFDPGGTRLVSGSDDQSLRLWDVASAAEVSRDRLAYLERRGRRAPTFEAVYQASLHVLGYRVDQLELKPEPRPLYLSPADDYHFPKPRRFWKLDQPRPPGEDPVVWMAGAMAASER